ncbi:hypothetical protein [Bradyrhizobium canariense]|uniref:hypothetical protein n=1 Tax=Bradyrhizobium canariense TaxID=255045 RepID=UPI000A198170|nr:hypothetical protein [Bradyrhizobium canariense]OSI33181.1 hypothetical protein BST65_03215 [Bradyrhizobium canariense]OSI37007.1 hypothetical protein BST66_04575 [Bradyrhizobium canariense]OSI54659.1 hypothetical protein BSZ20_02310 [Bradyrhizobium canariense]OSI56073.1 hypothetical protein BST67_04125 [Bradyrhizobium canariense]OSI59178.1 hypothetical protein BSZ15_06100 [Bradyrhizobium canariense]
MLRPKHWIWVFIVSAGIFGTKAHADDTVVRSFTGGSAASMVGIVPASEDVELAGPQALSADGQGNLFLLDQINGRIIQFDPKQPNSDPDVLKMPKDVQPTDLVVHYDDIMVWDGGVRTLKAAPGQSTRGLGGDVIQLEEVSSRGADDQVAVSAFAQMGSQAPGSAADLLDQNTRAAIIRTTRQPDRQYVASRSKGSVIADIIPDKGNASVRVEIQTMVTNETIGQLGLRVRNQLGTVEFLEIDNSDRFYVLAEDVPPSGKNASTFVARYAANGRLEGIYELPLENTPLTRRFVTVSGSGDVYFLRTKADGIEVIGVGFRPLTNASIIDVRPSRTTTAPAPQSGVKFDASAAVRPSNRQQAIETAFAFEGIQWKLTQANYGNDPDSQCSGFSRVRRPWYLQGKVNQEVRGVPYCWGCHGSLANFRQRIESGTLAGNVCTRNAPRPDVAGVDCSAFVSAAWGLSVHYTTAAIPAIAAPVANPWDLRPGDALNKPGSHVMLFLRFTPDRKAEVMESSTGGCNGRVCRNVYPLASLLARGYVPVRFRAFADDQTTVSAGAYQEQTEQPPAGRKTAGKRR